MTNATLKLATNGEVETLFEKAKKNPKYRLIVSLAIDAGLRVSEICSLKIGSFDFGAKLIRVKSLKKKSENPIYREIPMCFRLYEALGDYLKKRRLVKDEFLFPSDSMSGHISRIAVYKWMKKNSNLAVSPHMLRHTCATKVANEKGVRVAQNLLGHKSSATTEIYLHQDLSVLREVVETLDKPTLKEKIRRRFVKTRHLALDGGYIGSLEKTIGRRDEMNTIAEAMKKKINLYVVGEMGIGKSHLLEQIRGENVLRLDDVKQVKQTLKNLTMHLAKDHNKENMMSLYMGKVVTENWLTKASVQKLIEVINASCEKNEFTLVIDDLSHLTKSGVIVLEKLKEKFHMIVAARKLKIDYSTFMSNFQRLEVKKLNRENCIKMVYLLSKPMRNRIENYQAFSNYVIEQSMGNPLHLSELVERFSKEQYISYSELSSISHLNSRKYIDFSLPVILCLSSLMVLRYFGGEMGTDSGAYKLFGGIFMVFALFARSIFTMAKRKFV